LYEVLGLDRSASSRQVKSAYRRLARQFHPDRNAAPGATEAFIEAAEAYEVLSDSARRQLYDRWGYDAIRRRTAAPPGNSTTDPDEAFE
jgi:DnaJ-class molecular chaperone